MPERFGRPLGDVLRSCRLDTRLTIKAAAAQALIAPAYLSRIEAGKQSPNIELAERLAQVYGLCFFYSIQRAGKP